MQWTKVLSGCSETIEHLAVAGHPDESSKQAWMDSVQNGLLIEASDITIRNLDLSRLHVGVEIRGDNVTIDGWTADMISGDIFQGDGKNPKILNGRVTNALEVLPPDEYHPDITHFRGGSRGVIDGIEVVPSDHPWARKNYQGCMFSARSPRKSSYGVFYDWAVKNIDFPGVHSEHAVTFAEAHGCCVENVRGGGAVRFRDLNGLESTGCSALAVDGLVSGAANKNTMTDTIENMRTGNQNMQDIKEQAVDFRTDVRTAQSASRFRPVVNDDETVSQRLLDETAARLDLEVELLDALSDQEGLRKPFYKDHPMILFEPHVYTQLLNNMGVDVAGVLNNRPELEEIITYRRLKKYGSYAKQWDRFQLACQVSEEAAIGGCSWGTYSVMGYHWKALGYESAQALMQDAYTQAGQFRLMVGYLERVEPRTLEALRAKDFPLFKELYNGPAENDYAAEFAQKYRRALARRGPKKKLTKGHSRTMNAQTVDVGLKAGTLGGGLLAVNAAVKTLTDQVDALKSTQTDVSGLASTIEGMGWQSWAIIGLGLVIFLPNIRTGYAYLQDNGYISLKRWLPG